MLPTPIETSLLIAESMMLMPRGHPDAVWEVQRQMRLVNDAYSDSVVLRLTDQVVQAAARVHSMPGEESEDLSRGRARSAVARLWTYLELLPEPKSTASRVRRARARVR